MLDDKTMTAGREVFFKTKPVGFLGVASTHLAILVFGVALFLAGCFIRGLWVGWGLVTHRKFTMRHFGSRCRDGGGSLRKFKGTDFLTVAVR